MEHLVDQEVLPSDCFGLSLGTALGSQYAWLFFLALEKVSFFCHVPGEHEPMFQAQLNTGVARSLR